MNFCHSETGISTFRFHLFTVTFLPMFFLCVSSSIKIKSSLFFYKKLGTKTNFISSYKFWEMVRRNIGNKEA
jgi:hypothetical protein